MKISWDFQVNNRWLSEILEDIDMEPIFDLRCWTCGNGVPMQPNWGCNEGDDIHTVLVGARMREVRHPEHES